jgi:hypothetical protein
MLICGIGQERVCPWGQVSFSNVVFLRTMDSCLNFSSSLQSSLAAAFGQSVVTVDGPVLVSLKGSHSIQLPPNATSTQTTGVDFIVSSLVVHDTCLASVVFLHPLYQDSVQPMGQINLKYTNFRGLWRSDLDLFYVDGVSLQISPNSKNC